MLHKVENIIICIHCSSQDTCKNGHHPSGKQRWRCNNPECRKSFQLSYDYNACNPSIKEQIEILTLNSSGIRDTARVLKINKNTVIDVLRKKKVPK